MSDSLEASNDVLPEGWASTPLGRLISPSKEKIEPSLCPDAPYLSLEHIESGTSRIESQGRALDVKSTKAVFRHGDVLYGKLRPYLNKVAIPDFDGVCSTDILVFKPSEGVLPEYLLRFLSESAFVQYATDHQKGNSLPRVSFGDLAKFPLPLPPLAEQKRIVAKVEALLERVTKARERLDRVPDILKKFRQSVLAAACSGRLTADWREENSGQTAHELVEKVTALRKDRYSSACAAAKASGLRKPHAFDNELPNVRDDLHLFELPDEWQWVDLRFLIDEQRPFCYGVVQPGGEAKSGNYLVRAGDLDEGTVDISGLRTISAEVDAAYERSRLDGGEVLVTVVGANAGVAAIAPDSCRGFNIARAVAKLPIRDFNPSYLLTWLTSSTALEWMKRDAREVARPTLNLEQLKTLPVPLPPFAEQVEIVRRASSALDIVRRADVRVEDGHAIAERIGQSILAKAFAGELVETEADVARREGRDYEPASVLLQRIAAWQSETTSSIRLERGRAVLDILLLLEAWNQPVSISALEPALVLMRNDAARQILLDGQATRRPRRSLSTEPLFVRGLDVIYSGLEANGAIRRVGQSGFELVNLQLLSQANTADRAKAAEVLRAIQTLGDLRNLPQAVAAITHEQYEINV